MDNSSQQGSGDSALLEDLEKTPVYAGSQGKSTSEALMLPEASLKRMSYCSTSLLSNGYFKADFEVSSSWLGHREYH